MSWTSRAGAPVWGQSDDADDPGFEPERALHVIHPALAHFPPTRVAALDRLARADAFAYARERNHLEGPVTRLSPYVTHGLVDVPEIVDDLARRGVGMREKLVFELAWREYWHHVWRHLDIGILRDIRRPPSRAEYLGVVPRDVLEARTGVPAVDVAVRALYETGYVHNHARMWLASYLVHLRKVHWRVAADWFYGHVLDGDLGSNHLSWQWVAGTFSSKPYLFNDENVARYAPPLARRGTAIDRTYAELERLARSTERVGPEPGVMRGFAPPPLLREPPGAAAVSLPPVAGRDVVLAHPWSLCDPVPGEITIGVVHLPFHRSFPWSSSRWEFVMTRMGAISDTVFVGDLRDLYPRLEGAASLLAVATLNPGYREALAHPRVTLARPPRAFVDPDTLCDSFSKFWQAVARDSLRTRIPRSAA